MLPVESFGVLICPQPQNIFVNLSIRAFELGKDISNLITFPDIFYNRMTNKKK